MSIWGFWKAISPNDRLASTGLLVGECKLEWRRGVQEPTLYDVKHHSPWVIFKNGWKATTWQYMRRAKQSGTCTDPGLTSLVQVHDTHINKSFKNEMRRMRSSWREHNPGEQIKRENVIAWSQAAIDQVPIDLLSRGIMKKILENF